MLGRRLRHHAVAEIEDERAMAQLVEDALGLVLHCATADDQHDRIEIALHADVRLQLLRRPVRADAGVERQRREHVRPAIHQGRGPDGARKGDDRHAGMFQAHALGDTHHRIERPAEELFFRQHARVAIEKLDGIGARVDLVHQVIDDRIDQEVDQDAEGIGPAIGPVLHLGEVPAAAAFDHVAGEREGSAGEAQERGLLWQSLSCFGERAIDRRQIIREPRAGELGELGGVCQRLELGAFACFKPDFLAKGIGDHEDIGEDDRGIEAEAPDRLQRDLDSLLRRVAEFEEGFGRGTDRAIFRQVTPGLAHQPDRWRREARPGQCRQQFPAAHDLSLMPPSYSIHIR